MFCYFLLTAYHVSKLNKNKFCVSRSRLGGDKKKVPVKGHTLCSKAEICWDIYMYVHKKTERSIS